MGRTFCAFSRKNSLPNLYRCKSQVPFLAKNKCSAEDKKTALGFKQTLVEMIGTVRNNKRQFRTFSRFPGVQMPANRLPHAERSRLRYAKQPAAIPRHANNYGIRFGIFRMPPLLLFSTRPQEGTVGRIPSGLEVWQGKAERTVSHAVSEGSSPCEIPGRFLPMSVLVRSACVNYTTCFS